MNIKLSSESAWFHCESVKPGETLWQEAGGVGHASRSMLREIRFRAHLQHAAEKKTCPFSAIEKKLLLRSYYCALSSNVIL